MSEAFELLESLEENSVALVLTDVPYGIKKAVRIASLKHYTGDWDWDIDWRENPPIQQLCTEVARVLIPSGHFVVWCNYLHLSRFFDCGREAGLEPRGPFVYKKTNPVPRRRKVGPRQAVELSAWMTKLPISAKTYNWQLSHTVSNVFETSIPLHESRKRHEAQSPLYIGLWQVALLSKQGDLVVDPFAGSGTFPLAAKMLSRVPLWAERDPKWHDECQWRLKNEAGKGHPALRRFLHDVYSNLRYRRERKEILATKRKDIDAFIRMAIPTGGLSKEKSLRAKSLAEAFK